MQPKQRPKPHTRAAATSEQVLTRPDAASERTAHYHQRHKGVSGEWHLYASCTKHLNPLGLASLFVRSRAYQTSVTLPALVPALPLWTRIASALFIWMPTWWLKSMYTM